MAIRVVPHTQEFRHAARDFNKRMHDAGSRWGVNLQPESDWLATRPGYKVWREHHIAVDDTGSVRGGFALKPQEWIVHGEVHTITDWQGPVSEGSVNPRYATLAIRLMREMTRLYPKVFSWGHGGNDQPVVQMLSKMGWPMHETPFCLLILKPYRFLRYNSYLRKTKFRRLALDTLALTGAGPLALHIFHKVRRVYSRSRFSATARAFNTFEKWADELWEACKDDYAAIAVRDSASMNLLTPESAWPPVVRLRIEKDGQTIGWALVMHTHMQSDPRFGDLHVGSLVDCLAHPCDAGDVVSASTQYLQDKGVDLVVSNQAHPKWVQGFSDNGYLVLPNRRLFVTSPALRELLEPFDTTAEGLHLTNMDGHGPHAL